MSSFGWGTQSGKGSTTIEIDGDWLYADSIDFFGKCQSSPDRTYVVAWSDSDPDTGDRAFKEGGRGMYLLAHQGVVTVKGAIEGPSDGHVANNGTFVLSNWTSGGGLNGTFYAFGNSGEVLVTHHFAANLLRSGISSDGRFGACHTAFAETEEDSGVVAVFNLQSMRLLWKRRPFEQPAAGWPETFDFDVQAQTVSLVYPKFGRFAYSLEDGSFLDEDHYEAALEASGSGFDLLRLARHRAESLDDGPTPEGADKAVQSFKLAIERMRDYPASVPYVHRELGELLEKLGDRCGAIDHYERAVAMKPGIGVKRRLEHLRREV